MIRREELSALECRTVMQGRRIKELWGMIGAFATIIGAITVSTITITSEFAVLKYQTENNTRAIERFIKDGKNETERFYEVSRKLNAVSDNISHIVKDCCKKEFVFKKRESNNTAIQ